jgi:hypothetical protein
LPPTTACRTVAADLAAELGEPIVGRHDHAGVSERAERLRGLEAEAAERAEAAYGATAKARAEGLRRVFDERQAVPCRDLCQAFDPTGLAVQFDAEDRTRARTHGRGDLLGVELERIVANVDEARNRTDAQDRFDGGEERERRGDDFVSGTDAQGVERADQRIRTARHRDRVTNPEPRANVGLETLDFRP